LQLWQKFFSYGMVFKPNPGRIHHIQHIALSRPRLPTSQAVSEQVRLLRMEV